MTQAKLERWAGLAAVLNLAMIAILSGRPYFTNASRPVRGISSPILAMELVRNVSEVDAILGDAPSPDREVMRLKQYADFAFIGCYAALFVLMSRVLAPQGRSLAMLAAVAGMLAALFDVLENIGILRIVNTDLAHTTQLMIDAIRYPSLLKWALVALALGSFGILMWRSGRRGLQIVGVLDALASLLGFGGLYDNRLLVGMGLPMAGGLVGLAILFFRPRWHTRRRT